MANRKGKAMNPKILQEKLEQHLFENPEQSPIFIDSISKALNAYKSSINLQRHGQTMTVLNNISAFIAKRDVARYPYLFIEFFFILFPDAKPTYHSSVAKDLFATFQERMRELGDKGVEHVRITFNNDLHEWLLKLTKNPQNNA